MQFRKRKNMKQPSKTSIDYYILPNKILCGMAGLWPIDEDSSTRTKVFAHIRLIFGFIALYSILVPEIMLIIFHWGDLKILAGVGCVLTTLVQSLFKMVYLIARKDKTRRMYNEIRELWDISDDPKERQNYENFAYWARTLSIIFYLACMVNVFTFTVAAIHDYFMIEYNVSYAGKSRHLPFEVWYGIDITPSPRFEIAFFCQIVAVTIVAAAVAGLEGLCVTAILHVCGQFKLIGMWISKIGAEIGVKPVYLRKLEVDLIRCIRHHQRMINMVNDVNNLFAPIIFLHLLTSGLEICLSGFAVFDTDARIELLKFMSYFSSVWFQLLLWCSSGEILIQVSLDVGHVVYLNVPWYNLPPIYQRKLCMMIIRAQQYCSITALTFNTLSIHTLTNVFNTAASYFTLLRQMQQK